jgi:DNA-binding NtrC family response regulator
MTEKPSYEELEKRLKELETQSVALDKSTSYSNSQMEKSKTKGDVFEEIVTHDKKMLSIFKYINTIAPTSQPVLITGETGVGKELVARAIHNLSDLKGDFIAVNVSGLDDNVFSDTLFGHVKGAFTGAEGVRRGLIEKASNGTLLLDEIGDLHPASQTKMLRVLQESEYLPLGQDEPRRADSRIISTTNKDLWALQRAGMFREDLNFRLRTHHIHVPPLRERINDIDILLDHFLKVSARSLKKKQPIIPEELTSVLKTYPYPGNVRELQTMIFDAVTRQDSKILSLDTFESYIGQQKGDKTISFEPTAEKTAIFTSCEELPSIKQSTQLLVDEAMKRANGNQSVAAKMLGISQQALSKRLKGKTSKS